ncbi:MAG: hypothetical protein HY033_07600 [Ignavibacteriae bacterium]|nr:hypothetical protein [Ignavibacteriota bacterium]
MKGAKASMSSNMKSAAIIQTNYTADDANAAHCSKDSKECIAKGAKQASECTDAEKAHCNMTKASLTKAGTKSCCKAKGVEAKADAKKGAQEKSTDGKGTN